MGSDSAVIGGHDILALERFMDDTRHMIIFDVLTWKSPVGDKGERLRLFLSDKGYLLPFLCAVNIQASIVCELCEMVQNYSVDA